MRLKNRYCTPATGVQRAASFTAGTIIWYGGGAKLCSAHAQKIYSARSLLTLHKHVEIVR